MSEITEGVLWPNGSTTKPRLTSPYGPRPPIVTAGGTTYPFHYGDDLVGFADICSPVDGVVTMARWNGGYGNYVRILGANGDGFGHAHIAVNGFYVREGQRVTRGQKIARMGTTGKSTGVHLHWEVYKGNGAAVNPSEYMRTHAARPASTGSNPLPGIPNRKRKNDMSAMVIYTKGTSDQKRRGAVIDTESGFVSTFGWFHVGYANDLAIANGAASAAEVTDGHFDALVRDAKATAERLGKVSVDLDDADAVQIGKG